MTRFNQFFLKKLKFDHIFFSFWNLRTLKNSKQAVGRLHRMRIFVLNFLKYYTFFSDIICKSYSNFTFSLHFCKTCPNCSFQIFEFWSNYGQTMVKLIQEILALLNNYCFFRIIVSNSNGEMCDFMLKLNS